MPVSLAKAQSSCFIQCWPRPWTTYIRRRGLMTVSLSFCHLHRNSPQAACKLEPLALIALLGLPLNQSNEIAIRIFDDELV
jgi:hypothetical protein